MLETPKNGWGRIQIGEWSDRCSYLDDVPYMLLEALEHVCRTGAPSVLKFDAEGYEYVIVFDSFDTHVITDNEDGYVYRHIKKDCCALAKELVEDVQRDLEHWAHWGYDNMSEDEVNDRRLDLGVLCGILEKRI